jgi:hypothetical protein
MIHPGSLESDPTLEPTCQSPEFIRLQLCYCLGSKVTIYFSSFLGKPSALKVTVLDGPEAHGFITPSGGWSLVYIPRGEENTAVSYRVKVRKFRRRKLTYLRLDEAVSIKLGW